MFQFLKRKLHHPVIRPMNKDIHIIPFQIFWAFPCGSRYPLYLFCLIRIKKDAAAIPNATFNVAL